MDNKVYAIKTKIFDKIEYVIVSEDELADSNKFIKKGKLNHIIMNLGKNITSIILNSSTCSIWFA